MARLTYVRMHRFACSLVVLGRARVRVTITSGQASRIDHVFCVRATINVVGVRFETTLTTIRRIPDSMLAIMFSGQHTVHKDDDGFVFIDRSPTHFEDILSFLRTGSVPIGTPDQEFEAELEYYGLHQAFLDAGGQEMLDPTMINLVPEYLLLTISASMHLMTEERILVVISAPSTVGPTLTKLEQMLS
eukprot:3840311-Prymnesium_polylepis.1